MHAVEMSDAVDRDLQERLIAWRCSPSRASVQSESSAKCSSPSDEAR